MNRLLLLLSPSPNELFSHPLRWAAKHLAFYAGASLVAGALFVAGAGVYARFVPLPEIAQPAPAPAILPEPAKTAPAAPSENPDPGTVVSTGPQLGIPFKYTLGAQVVDSKKAHLGWIREMSVTPSGSATVTIQKPDGAFVTAPADAFSWANEPNAKVEAVVKPTVDFKRLFGG
jgi:hypothetical protein